MAKEKFNISALSSAIEEKEQAEIGSEKLQINQKSIASPINAPSMSQKSSRIQRLYIDLPVSKERVECDLIEISPDQCLVSPLNKRVQSLLSSSDPAIQQLKQRILEDKQRDPVLLRPLEANSSGIKYELVYGSRRRFAVQLLNSEGYKDIKLKAWLSPSISDVDAKKLADSENDDRQEISAWELAKYYEKLRNDNSGFTPQYIAINEQSTASTIRRYLQLATLPENIVRKVLTPTEISLRSGLDILKHLNTLSKNEKDRVLEKIDKEKNFDSAAELLRAIKAITISKKPSINRKQPLCIEGKDGERKATIGAHRTIDNQYKIDLFGISDEDINRVVAALEVILKK